MGLLVDQITISQKKAERVEVEAEPAHPTAARPTGGSWVAEKSEAARGATGAASYAAVAARRGDFTFSTHYVAPKTIYLFRVAFLGDMQHCCI